ncbi:MAG: hypothetical protein BAJATHORv1_30093 [Candidatus Thorarchaeota archaeon]|nr:MAG: hypothetical protein BAJATHORv1_30093 [Candidatus Thorarchaeota archaeon]
MEERADHSDDFEKGIYFDILKEELPMKSYVSRGDTRDEIDIVGPHQNADRAIERAIRFTLKDNRTRFQPVLGSAGLGKTHLFWVLKDQEDEVGHQGYLAVYVPSPPAPVRVPLHFHACLVDEAGDDIFEKAVDMLITRFGGVKGSTHEQMDFSYAMDRLLGEYPGISADVVTVLLRYRLDPDLKHLARRWLFGNSLSEEEIEKLGVRTILEEDDVTLATLRLLAEGYNKPILLFVDEMEGPYNTHGEEGERHFLEVIKRLYNECKNMVIVASCLTEIWDRIYNIADAPMRSRMEVPANLRPFTKEDVVEFVKKTMEDYWQQQNVVAPPDPIFPFTEDDLDEVFVESQGVPREAIKRLIPKLDSIVYDRAPVEPEPQPDYVIKLTSTTVLGAIMAGLQEASREIGAEVRLVVEADDSSSASSAVLEVTKDSSKTKLCIDVPNVRDWDRSGGVAAYYSAKRVKDQLDAGGAQMGIIAIPEATGGAKFQAHVDEMGDAIEVLRMDKDGATALVELSHGKDLKPELRTLLTSIIERLIE